MRIAVVYENGQIFQHFGHAEMFKLYTVEGGQVVSTVVLPTGGAGHDEVAVLLAAAKADVLICGALGGGARAALERTGIAVYPGVVGMADQAVAAFLAGGLRYDPNAGCAGGCGGCGHHHGCGGHEGGCHAGCGHHGEG